MGHSAGRDDAPCRTPGCVYETEFTHSTITLRVKLPLQVVKFRHVKTKTALAKEFHDAILPVMEKFYNNNWHLFAGKTLPLHDQPMPEHWWDL